METTSKAPRHVGRRIGRIREMLGVKQETLAEQMGITQQAVSKLEQSEELEEKTLERVAKALGVPAKAIENFNEESVFNIISNTFHNTSSDQSTLISSSLNYYPTFNTIEKIVDLYERLIQAEKEKVALMEKMLKG
ncbi:MAG: helix-turn-helix transcriptional regulator [Cyclobacteriaceae bacterium]|nr:helix-turn-helix transcriptional regulator [Cyclobacteriaceae bacterium]